MNMMTHVIHFAQRVYNRPLYFFGQHFFFFWLILLLLTTRIHEKGEKKALQSSSLFLVGQKALILVKLLVFGGIVIPNFKKIKKEIHET